MRGLALLLILAASVFALNVVASVKSLAIIAEPVVGNVKYLMPPGASPLFWKPGPQQVQEALQADIFLNTLHWPFERQIAEQRSGPSLPPLVPGTPAVALSELGFAVLRMPNGELNPHGWWLYAPNAFQLMGELAAKACQLEPQNCLSFVKAFEREVETSRKVLEECFMNGKKAVVMLPGEQYIVANFGVQTTYVVMQKGPVVTGLALRKAVDALRSSDFLVVSDMSANTPAARYMIAYAHRLGKPVVKVYLLNPPVNTFHDFLRITCEALSEGR